MMNDRVFTPVHCTPPEWDISPYEVSPWKILFELCFGQKLRMKITKTYGRQSNMSCALHPHEIYPTMLPIDTSNAFWDTHWTKMWDERTDGHLQ